MKLAEHTIIYGTGGGTEVSHVIEKIAQEQTSEGTLYTFYYSDAEGEKSTLSFTYNPDTRSIQIKHSNEIWQQTGTGGS